MAVPHDENILALNPRTLEPGEQSTVLDRVVHVLNSDPVRVSAWPREPRREHGSPVGSAMMPHEHSTAWFARR